MKLIIILIFISISMILYTSYKIMKQHTCKLQKYIEHILKYKNHKNHNNNNNDDNDDNNDNDNDNDNDDNDDNDNDNNNNDDNDDIIDMNYLLKDYSGRKITNINIKPGVDTNYKKNKKDIIMSIKRKSRKKSDNTLRHILNAILSNSAVKSVLNIEDTDNFTKTYYKSVMIKLGLEPGQMKIKDMLQIIMINLPPISIIENIIDEHFSLNSISNKEDKECVLIYLEKKI
jgi:hypothetical protein